MSHLAADGQLFVCTCCGRKAVDLLEYDDPSCACNAVLCYASPLVVNGRSHYVIVDSQPTDSLEGSVVPCRM